MLWGDLCRSSQISFGKFTLFTRADSARLQSRISVRRAAAKQKTARRRSVFDQPGDSTLSSQGNRFSSARARERAAMTVSIVNQALSCRDLSPIISTSFSRGAWTWSDHFAFVFTINRERLRAIRIAWARALTAEAVRPKSSAMSDSETLETTSCRSCSSSSEVHASQLFIRLVAMSSGYARFRALGAAGFLSLLQPWQRACR